MKVVCVNNGKLNITNSIGDIITLSSKIERLTNGKIYDVIDLYKHNDNQEYCRIIDDKKYSTEYNILRFMSLKEYRKQKLNEILK